MTEAAKHFVAFWIGVGVVTAIMPPHRDFAFMWWALMTFGSIGAVLIVSA